MTAITLGIACVAETQRMRAVAQKLTKTYSVSSPRSSVEETACYFEQILNAHRSRLEPRQVQFLSHLCFPLPGTRDPHGMRYVLWRPLVQLLEQGFPVDVEDWMCGGEVGLVYLEHKVGGLVEKIYPAIERTRLKNPYPSALSALQLTANTLLDVYDSLASSDPGAAAAVDEMRRRFIAYVRNSRASTDARSVLAGISRNIPDWAAHACVDFLRKVQAEDVDLLSLSHASEGSLTSDWTRAEEDAAWSHLPFHK
jgi:hypothetical protein